MADVKGVYTKIKRLAEVVTQSCKVDTKERPCKICSGTLGG